VPGVASDRPAPRPIVIVGATGTGKSELSLTLAELLRDRGMPAEIVNADAMQLYRGMDIGTAKVPQGERRGIQHHLLDVLDPREEASVADYQVLAREAVEDIERRGALPILVGGSGLYVSSVIQDFTFPGTDREARARLEAELDEFGPARLHARLATLDAGAATAIGPHNGRRLVRALEVIELTGEKFGSGLPEDRPVWRDCVIIALEAPRPELVERLGERVRGMWRAGLLDEAAGLFGSGLGTTASRAIGYAQAIGQLEGRLTEAEAIDDTIALTRRYARRQVSWFRRYVGAHWLAYQDPDLQTTALHLAIGEN
jgi:tRNA dimethylallyltransferase